MICGMCIAVNITNAELQGAVVTLRGIIRHRARLPLHGQDGNTVLVQLFSFIDGLVKATDRPLLGIGISTPGLIDTTSGIVRRAVNFGWQDLLLRNIVQSHFNLPIYVANDSHMVALAEYMFGQPQSSANLVVIKVGQGIGAGIVLNGQLFSGDDHGAGEIGHVVVVEDGPLCKCGNHGCLEAVASIAWIVRRAQEIAEVVTTSPLSQYRRRGPHNRSGCRRSGFRRGRSSSASADRGSWPASGYGGGEPGGCAECPAGGDHRAGGTVRGGA